LDGLKGRTGELGELDGDGLLGVAATDLGLTVKVRGPLTRSSALSWSLRAMTAWLRFITCSSLARRTG
jgi:hypothetical protein